MSSEQIDSIYIEALLDTSKLKSQIVQLKKQSIVVPVDDSNLTKLNQHLDLKVKHFKEVNQFFKQNPLKISIDSQGLTKVSSDLQAIKKQAEATRLQLKLDTSALSLEIKKATQELATQIAIKPKVETAKASTNTTAYEQIGKTIAQSIDKSISGNLFGNIANLTVGSVFRGAFEGLGRNLSKDFNKGLANSLTQGINQSIGSAELVGKKLGDSLVSTITDSLPENLKDSLTEAVNFALGETDIVVAKYLSKRKVTRKEERAKKLADEQINLDKRAFLQENRSLKIEQQTVQTKLNVNKSTQEKGFKLQNELLSRSILGENLADEIEEVANNLAFLAKEELDLLKEQENLNDRLKQAKKNLENTKKAFDITAPDALPQVYAQALKDVVGVRNMTEQKIPKLVVNDSVLSKLGANASYAVESNSLMISSEMQKAISANRLDAEQMKTLYHELQHAKDFDFGSVRGVEAHRNNVFLSRPLKASKEELRELAPFLAQYDLKDRPSEMQAELSGRRKGGKAFESQQMFVNAKEFTKTYGKNAEKLTKLVDTQFTDLTKNLGELTKFAVSKGVDVGAELKEYLANVSATKKELQATISGIVDIQGLQLKPDEVKEVETSLSQQLEKLENLQKYLQVLTKSVLLKAKNLVKTPIKTPELEKVEIERAEAEQKKYATTDDPWLDKPSGTGNKSVSKDVSPIEKAAKASKEMLAAFEEGLQRINQKILPNFKDTFQSFRKDLKAGNINFVNEENLGALAKAKTLLESIRFAKEDIEKTRDDLGIPKIGTEQASKVNQTLSQLSRIEKSVKRELQVELNKREKQKASDTGEDLRARLDPLKINRNTSEEDKKTLKELNKLLENISDSMDDFDFGYEKANQKMSESFEKSTNTIKDFTDNLFNTEKQLENFDSLINGVFDNVGAAVTGFASFAALAIAAKQLLDFSATATQVAREMEAITMQVSNIAGGGIQGSRFVEEIRKTAENLRLNVKDTLEASASFIASVEGTSIEGALGEETFKNFQQLLAARNISAEKSKNFLTGLEQAASKGLQSEELRGQMAEAVGGVIGIFSRSQGQSNREFLNRMRNTQGGLDQSVLFEASQQAAAETTLSMANSFDTLDSKVRNTQNKFLILQETVGRISLPIEKFKFDAIAAGLDLVIQHSETIRKTLTVLALYFTKGLWLKALSAIQAGWFSVSAAAKAYTADLILMGKIQTAGMTKLQAAQFVAVQGFTKMKAAVFSAVKVFAPLLAIHATIEGIGAVANSLRIHFSDLSGDIGNFVKNAEKAVESLEKLNKTGKKTREEDNIDFATDVQSQTEKYRASQGFFERFNPFDTGQAEGNKRAQDSLKAAEKLVALSNQIRQQSNAKSVFGNIDDLTRIDGLLRDIRNKREAINKTTPGDVEGLAKLRKQESELAKERADVVLVVGGFQSAIEQRVQELKATRKDLEEQAKKGFIFEENYKKAVSGIDKELEALEKQQQKITKAIGKSKTAFDLFRRSIQETTARQADILLDIENNKTLQDLQNARLANSGDISRGGLDSLSQISEIQNRVETFNANQQFIQKLEERFKDVEAESVLKAFNVTRQTGVNELNRLVELIDNEKQKFILQEFANLQTARQQLNQIELDLVNSKNQMIDRFRDLTKQVNNYYLKASQEAETAGLETKKLVNQNSNLRLQSRLREAVSGGYSTIIGSIVEGVEEALNSFTNATDKAIESQRDLLTTNFKIQDNNQQAFELRQTIPDIQVDLDFSKIPTDNNITELSEQVNQAISSSDLLGRSLDFNIQTSENFGKSLAENVKPLEEQEKANTLVNKSLQQSVNRTIEWFGNLKTIPDEVDNIQDGFSKVENSLTGVLTQTTNWLTQLGNAPGLIGKALEGFNDFTKTTPDGSNKLLSLFSAGENSSVLEPVDRSKYRITSGYGWRTIFGGRDFHEGLDYATPVGTEIKAPVSGKVSHVGNLGDAGFTVKIEGLDSKGRKTEDMLLHLSKALVKVGDLVTQGQVVAKSGNTGRSTGAHLDWRRKVNGKWQNPQVALNEKLPPISAQAAKQATNQITRGGNLLNSQEKSKLTSLGKKLYQFQQNPYILAFADTVARAEGTDFRGNSKNFGYSMLIGGQHDSDFSRHPFAGNSGSRIRPPRHNSTASGRYQMMDFNYSRTQAQRQFGRNAKSDLANVFKGENPGSFSPAVQDLYFIYSLHQRGILDKVLQGNFEGALKKPQYC